jgi:hypothetical protein
MQAYQKAGELAMERGDNELVVVARMSIGRLSGAIP